MADHTVEIKTGTIVKALVIIAAFGFAYLLRDVLIILFSAIVIASAVGPFADWFEKRKIPRIFSVLVLYVTVFSLLMLVLSLAVPFLSLEINQLTSSLPKLVTNITGALEKAQQGNNAKYFDFFGEIQNSLDSFSQFLQISSQSVLSMVTGIFGGVFSFLAIVVISFDLSVMKQGIISFIKSVAPEQYEDYILSLWHRTEKKVGRWLQGQLLLALSVGLVVFIGLSLFNVKYALLLGLLSMGLEIVPIAGPVISAIPGVILAFIQDPTLGLWVLLFYVVVQQLEGHVLTPLILGRTLGVNPITVILALLIGAQLAGILGILLAVPVSVVIVEILDDVASRKQSRRAASGS